MATVKAFIRVSTKKDKKSDKSQVKSKKIPVNSNVRFRLSDGRDIQLFHKSEIEIDHDIWDIKNQCIKAKIFYDAEKRESFNKSITDRKNLMQSIYGAEPKKDGLTSEWLDLEIDKTLNPVKYIIDDPRKRTFFELFDEFIVNHKVSQSRKNNFRVVMRAMQRYELYTAKITGQPFKLTLDNVTGDTLRDIDSFLRNEVEIYTKMPEIIKAVPECRTPVERGQNTLNNWFTKLKTFFLYSIDGGETQNNPFKNIAIEKNINGNTSKIIIKGFKIGACKYGTPFYISIEERNHLYHSVFPNRPQLAVQRDIFVFQSLIGCRVGDLYKMTKSNIIDGFIQYVPGKTKEENSNTVKVPLNSTAKEILRKYPENKGGRLLPFISEQKYNKAIRDMFELAELTRIVTVINPKTGEAVQKGLHEIASSHLARRSFIGGLYKQVSDPNLIGSMTGHVEGSKSFARYREIDDDMKTKLVKMLD